MRCQHCAAEIPEGAAFCPMCGQRLGDAPPPEATETPQSRAHLLQQKVEQVRHTGDIQEQELWRGTYSYKAMTGEAIFAGIGTLVGLIAMFWMPKVVNFIILGAIGVLWLYLGLTLMRRRIGLRYRLTNQRLFIESGVFRRLTERIEVIEIDDIDFTSDFFERLSGVGSIILATTDDSAPKVRLDGIENVAEVFNLIDQSRRAERNRRGLYIESA